MDQMGGEVTRNWGRARGRKTVTRICCMEKIIFSKSKDKVTSDLFPKTKSTLLGLSAHALQTLGLSSDSQSHVSIIQVLLCSPSVSSSSLAVISSPQAPPSLSLGIVLCFSPSGQQYLMFYSHPAGSQVASSAYMSCSQGLPCLSVKSMTCFPSVARHSILCSSVMA